MHGPSSEVRIWPHRISAIYRGEFNKKGAYAEINFPLQGEPEGVMMTYVEPRSFFKGLRVTTGTPKEISTYVTEAALGGLIGGIAEIFGRSAEARLNLANKTINSVFGVAEKSLQNTSYLDKLYAAKEQYQNTQQIIIFCECYP